MTGKEKLKFNIKLDFTDKSAFELASILEDFKYTVELGPTSFESTIIMFQKDMKSLIGKIFKYVQNKIGVKCRNYFELKMASYAFDNGKDEAKRQFNDETSIEYIDTLPFDD